MKFLIVEPSPLPTRIPFQGGGEMFASGSSFEIPITCVIIIIIIIIIIIKNISLCNWFLSLHKDLLPPQVPVYGILFRESSSRHVTFHHIHQHSSLPSSFSLYFTSDIRTSCSYHRRHLCSIVSKCFCQLGLFVLFYYLQIFPF